MTRWRCPKHCCEPFSQATAHQPAHLCAVTGTVDPYVADTAPALSLVGARDAGPVFLRAVA